MRQNPHVLLTFDKVHHPLRLLCKTTSECPQVLRTPQFFAHLTLICASRHNGVHFFNISTSKSALNPSVFYAFDFKTRFAPQRRAFFRHHNFQKWSEHGMFCTFWVGNVLRATTACNFSETFSLLIFFLLLLSSLTLPISAFDLSILSEVWLLNFLRQVVPGQARGASFKIETVIAYRVQQRLCL